MGEIKQILFPTDFSKNAEKALNYAIEIAGSYNADIIILHTYYPYSLPLDQEEFREEEVKNQEERTRRLMKETESLIYEKNKNIVTHRLIRSGKTVDILLEVAKEKKVDLIIMGTKGASGIKEALLGTNTAEVISSSHYPVLAVPEKANFSGIKDVVFAAEFSSSNELRKLNTTTAIFKNFSPDMTILELADGVRKEQLLEMASDNGVRQVIEQSRFESPCGDKKDKEKCIRQYLKSNPADILCLSRKKKGFLQSLFSEDYVKELTYHADLPMLVIPG